MKNNRHELVFVLDQSASIENWIDEAPKALKALFKKQKKEQLETKTTITVFGSEYRTACENKDIEKVSPNSKVFGTSGVCPFIDSMTAQSTRWALGLQKPMKMNDLQRSL